MERTKNVCCICLQITKVMHGLKSEDQSKLTLLAKLQSLAPKQIWFNYYLICISCYAELDRAYNFKQLCIKNESIRQTIILQPTEEDSPQCLEVHECYEEEFNCFHCQESFNSKISIELHLLNKKCYSPTVICKKVPKFTCDKCSEAFMLLKDITRHCKSVHLMQEKDIKPYKCTTCGNKFRSVTVLIQHQKYHESVRPFICSTCGKDFFTKQDLNAHENYHDNKRSYLCKECNKSFKTKSNLSTHMLVSHTDKCQWKYSCLICLKKFALKSHLNDHIKRHEGSKQFACHICHKNFITKSELTVHIKNHSNIRQYQCKLCSKCYRDKRNLAAHLSKEHGEGNFIQRPKTFFCHSCPKSFPDRFKLNRHLRTHTGQKPFSCVGCCKQFSDSRNLKRHMQGCVNSSEGQILKARYN